MELRRFATDPEGIIWEKIPAESHAAALPASRGCQSDIFGRLSPRRAWELERSVEGLVAIASIDGLR